MIANTSDFTNQTPSLTSQENGSDSSQPEFLCDVLSGTSYFTGGLIISASGLFLNAAFIFVFCRVKYMRTLTNGYLVNLAVSDSLLLSSVLMYFIFRLAELGPLRSATFNCFLTYLHAILLLVSIWMITIVSIERYLCICNPLKARLFNTRGRVAALIACTWILSMICSSPKLVHCAIADSDSEQAQQFEITLYIFYVLMFFLSIVTVACMYSFVVVNFKKSVRKLGKERRNTRKSDDTQVLVTCMIISIVFFVCTFPSAYKYVLYLLYRATNVNYGGHFTICMYGLARWLLLINSSVNPLIYTITSARCRKAFAIAFWCHSTKDRRTTTCTLPPSSAYVNSMTTNLGADV
ncbi:substance-K receptor-like [Ptychodera flava]|uniref:substance-K receptor-like n=1 Tax=Ptychodera flava TaxID=63121 RepID=UPI00396A963E